MAFAFQPMPRRPQHGEIGADSTSCLKTPPRHALPSCKLLRAQAGVCLMNDPAPVCGIFCAYHSSNCYYRSFCILTNTCARFPSPVPAPHNHTGLSVASLITGSRRLHDLNGVPGRAVSGAWIYLQAVFGKEKPCACCEIFACLDLLPSVRVARMSWEDRLSFTAPVPKCQRAWYSIRKNTAWCRSAGYFPIAIRRSHRQSLLAVTDLARRVAAPPAAARRVVARPARAAAQAYRHRALPQPRAGEHRSRSDQAALRHLVRGARPLRAAGRLLRPVRPALLL